MLEDPGELGVVKHPVLDGSLAVHLIHIVVSEPFPHGGQQFPETVLMDEPAVVVVKAPKGVLDDVFRVGALEALPKQGEEHGEVDGSGSLVHHALQVIVGGVLAQGSQHVVEVLLVDEPIPVLVNHVEGLLELLDLVLVEHGEDVGSGPLGALLGRATSAGGFAGRHLDKKSLHLVTT